MFDLEVAVLPEADRPIAGFDRLEEFDPRWDGLGRFGPGCAERERVTFQFGENLKLRISFKHELHTNIFYLALSFGICFTSITENRGPEPSGPWKQLI